MFTVRGLSTRSDAETERAPRGFQGFDKNIVETRMKGYIKKKPAAASRINFRRGCKAEKVPRFNRRFPVKPKS
jgi:hypothetical protein